MAHDQSTYVGGIYRNIEAQPWQSEFHRALSRSPDIERVKPSDDWRVHLFTLTELQAIPSNTFNDQEDLDAWLACIDSRGIDHDSPVLTGAISNLQRSVCVFLLESVQLANERRKIADKLRQETGVDIRYRKPDGRPVDYDFRFVVGDTPAAVDLKLVRKLCQPFLPRQIQLLPLKTKLVSPKVKKDKWWEPK